MTAKQLPLDPSPPPGLQRIAAGFCLLISLVGVGLSVHLTRLKFEMLYTPCLSAYGGCQIGGYTCDDALMSPLSMLAGLPISLWGASFYVTTSVAAGLALRRGPPGRVAALLLLALASFAVLVSAALGGYTAAALASACPFCMSLYVVSALLLGGALLCWRAPGGASAPVRDLLRERPVELLDGVFALAMVLVLATGGQSMTFHGLRNLVDGQDGCVQMEAPLPAPSIRVGDEDPQAILAVFLDFTCTKCRGEFKQLSQALRAGKFPAPVQLWVYHTPRHACDLAAFPGGYDRTDDGARFDNACMAARAVECMEGLKPGSGYELMGGLFALHDDRQPNVPLFTAERIGNKAVELELEIDPDDEENPLVRCINHDSEVLARITAHQRFADRPAFSVPTVLIYHAAGGAPDPARGQRVANASTSLATLLQYVAEQAAAAPQP